MKLSIPATRAFSLETLAHDIHENRLLYTTFIGLVSVISVFAFVLITVS